MGLGSDILKYYEQLRSQYYNFFFMGQDIVDYMMPSHKDITVTRKPGEKKTQKIYDSTAPNGILLITSFVHGSVFPEGSQWFDSKHAVERLNENKDVTAYLQGARKAQLSSFRQSNFYSATIEMVQDWLVFGNGCVIQERTPKKRPGLNPLVFTSVGFGSYVFFEGEDKRPGGLIRELEMSADEMRRKWGEDKLSDRVKVMLKERPFDTVRIVHAIVPRDIVRYKRLATPKEMPWASLWFEKEEPKRPALEESGYPEKPFAIARYNVIAGEVLGRGLGELALPDVKTLNDATRRGFIEWDKSLDPPINKLMGAVVGDVSHRPGSQNIIKKENAITLMDKDLRVGNQTHQWNMDDRRKAVKEVFFSDKISGLLAAEEQPRNQTAYQYSKRLELMHLVMAPTGGRLYTEAIRDIVETNYSILFRTNQLPPLPDLLRVLAKTEEGNRTEVTYESPLAKSQRQEEIGNITEFLQIVDSLGQAHPEVLAIPNVAKMLRKISEAKSLQHLCNDEKTSDQINQLKNQLAQLQAALQAAEHASKTAKNLAPVMKAQNDAQAQDKAA
jgi:hypothetical protein